MKNPDPNVSAIAATPSTSGCINSDEKVKSLFCSLMLIALVVICTSSESYAQTRAYVTNINDSTVSVVDIPTNIELTRISVGSCPTKIVITPDNGHAYVTNSCSNDVSVIETTGNTVIATIPVTDSSGNRGPQGIAVTPDGKHVYVTNFIGDVVTVINTSDGGGQHDCRARKRPASA